MVPYGDNFIPSPTRTPTCHHLNRLRLISVLDNLYKQLGIGSGSCSDDDRRTIKGS